MSDSHDPSPHASPVAPSADAPAAAAPVKGTWVHRAEAKLKAVGEKLGALLGGVFSSDPSERLASWVFLLSTLGGVFFLSVGVWWAIQENRAIERAQGGGEAGKNLAHFLKQQADDAKKDRVMTVSLGLFTVDLSSKLPAKSVETSRRLGVVQAAEIEIILECDSQEACVAIGKLIPQARSEVVGLMAGMDRDELLSREGKRKLRKMIQDRINQWMSGAEISGKVENVYIGRLVVG